MTNTTTTHNVTMADVATIAEKVAALKGRAAKRGWDVTLEWSVDLDTPVGKRYDGTPLYELTATYGGSFGFDGGWRLVGVAEAAGTSEPLVFTFDDTFEFGDMTVDMTRCDHCHRAIRRNKVLILVNDEGSAMHVGGSCSVDFLGHDPEWAFWIGEAFEFGGGDYAPKTVPVRLAVAAAIEANRLGYRKSADTLSTRDLTVYFLTGRGGKEIKEMAGEVEKALPATHTVDEVLAWMRDESGEGDFGRNMRTIANSEEVPLKKIGIVAYAPAGADRWREKMAELAARRAAEEARKAEALPVPVTDRRIRVEGVVASIKEVYTDFGVTWKMRVVTTDGWAVWGSVPGNIGVEVGDRVAFDARVERSRDDELFGFFSRPTKAVVLEEVAV